MSLIEREAAIAAFREQGCLSGGYHSTEEIENDAVAMLEGLPPIDAAPVVHGRWEKDCTEEGRIIEYFCSVCGTSLDSHPRMHFCPSCGARMDGGEEDG